MTETKARPGAKASGIDVLRCAAPGCHALLAYEIDAEGFLYVDLAWTARSTPAGNRYFPCPRCGARNVIEFGIDARGRRRPRVGGVEASTSEGS